MFCLKNLFIARGRLDGREEERRRGKENGKEAKKGFETTCEAVYDQIKKRRS